MSEPIDIYGGDYEHTLTVSGTWSGISLRYVTRPVLEIFEAMLTRRAHQVCEFSLSNYLMLRSRGEDWISAVPIFPYRAFRHSTLHVRKDSGLTSPKQLLGKRVGVPDFSMTAAVWTRGILLDQYGVDWRSLTWVSGLKSRFALDPEIEVERTADDLEDELIAGRLDALLTPHTRDESKAWDERKLRPLIPDINVAEQEYFASSGIYPINHVICVRVDLPAQSPMLPKAVIDAYEAGKSAAYQRRLGTTFMPWAAQHWDAVFDKFGADPLPYGLGVENRRNVETLISYLHQQKLISDRMSVDSVFVQ